MLGPQLLVLVVSAGGALADPEPADPSRKPRVLQAQCSPLVANFDAGAPFAGTINHLRCRGDESRDLRAEALFFEPSKVVLDLSGPQRALFEADVDEPFFPFQNRASSRDKHFGGASWAFAVTPKFRVRQLSGDSLPVRTPSYMPKVTFQANRLGMRTRATQWGERGPVGLWSVLVIPFGHHSNGQDGCAVDFGSGIGGVLVFKDGTRECQARLRSGPIIINRTNGSFSTNYTAVSLYRAWLWMRNEDEIDRTRVGLTSDRVARDVLFVGGSYENHWGFAEPLRDYYGTNRFELTLGYTRAYRRQDARRVNTRALPRMTARAMLRSNDRRRQADDCGSRRARGPEATSELSALPCAPRFGFVADLAISLGSHVDYVALYARYTRAQDEYNLNFTHRKWNAFQVGLTFTPGRSVPYRLPKIPDASIEEEVCLTDEGWPLYRGYVKAYSKARDPRRSPQRTPTAPVPCSAERGSSTGP